MLPVITETNSGIKTNETPTSCVVHLADSSDFKVSASNNLCNGLTVL